MDELGQLGRERDGHGRGHGRFEGRHRDRHRDGGRQERVSPGHGLGPAGPVRAAGRFGEGPRVGPGGRHVHGVDRVEGRHASGRGRRVEVRPGQRAAGWLERRREPAVEGVARLEGLRDAREREFGQGPGRGGRFREERRERVAVLVDRRPQPEVGRGQVRLVVSPGVRDVAVAGPGRGWLVHEERRERGRVDVERRREPAVEVQAGRTVPAVRDGVVPSVLRAVARARAVARVRQSGLHRRHGDDEGVRRLVEGHGAFRGLHEGRPVVLVRLHVR